jgi:hypothetical protein
VVERQPWSSLLLKLLMLHLLMLDLCRLLLTGCHWVQMLAKPWLSVCMVSLGLCCCMLVPLAFGLVLESISFPNE